MPRLVAIALVVAGCANGPAAVERTPIGVIAEVGAEPGPRRACLTIADSTLMSGDRLTAANIPFEAGTKFAISVVEITEVHPGRCAGLYGEYGDADYYVVGVDRENVDLGPAVAVSIEQGLLTGANGVLQVDSDHDGRAETFRVCTSMEGLHLTLWEGAPLRSSRLWHKYLPLGYDVEPTCSEADL